MARQTFAPLTFATIALVGLVGCSASAGSSGGQATGAGAPPSETSEDAGSLPARGDDSGAISTGSPGSTGPDAGAARDAATPPSGAIDAAADAPSASAPTTRVVAYLPNYNGSYADWAKSIDFATMTHLNLAFATANGSNAWDMGASDADVAAIVTAAHAAGVKVIASLGGGGGDQTVIAQYKTASNVAPLVANLDTFVSSHAFDGVDIDIEDPANLGAGYTTFVNAVVAKLRPEGKLVTAAVAQYLQDSMEDDTLHTFDFLNVMIYSTYSDSVSAMTYYAETKSVPKAQICLGAGFFGDDSAGNEYAYSAILAADSTAWSKDSAQVNGQTVSYTGMASMKKLADYSKGYGGIMFWELTEDTTDEHSLYKVIQGEM